MPPVRRAVELLSEFQGIQDEKLLKHVIRESLSELKEYHRHDRRFYGHWNLSTSTIFLEDFTGEPTCAVIFLPPDVKEDAIKIRRPVPKSERIRDIHQMGYVIRALRYGTGVQEYAFLINQQVQRDKDDVDDLIEACLGGMDLVGSTPPPIISTVSQTVEALLEKHPLERPLKNLGHLFGVLRFLHDSRIQRLPTPLNRHMKKEEKILVRKSLPIVRACQVPDGDGIKLYLAEVDFEEISDEIKQKALAAREPIEIDGRRYAYVKTKDGTKTFARQYEIRLRAIDAPELRQHPHTSQKHAEEARQALWNLVHNKKLAIEFVVEEGLGNHMGNLEKDVYGKRYICNVYTGGSSVQEVLLKKGCVWHFKRYDIRKQLGAWQEDAQNRNYGLWGERNPQPPWEFREQNPPPPW